jgi:hypothetical protein
MGEMHVVMALIGNSYATLRVSFDCPLLHGSLATFHGRMNSTSLSNLGHQVHQDSPKKNMSLFIAANRISI